MSALAIHCENLQYRYPEGAEMTFPDISCSPSGAVLIIGKSGSGKTTMLHLLAGLRSPASGRVLINGTDVTALSGKERDTHRGKYAGIVFQTPHFVANLSAVENLMLPAYFTGQSFDKSKALHLLEKLDLAAKASKLPGRLSAGEQQRLGIARAVIHSPAVVFADEPTSALDDENAAAVTSLLTATAQENASALIVVTHDSRLKSSFNQIIEL